MDVIKTGFYGGIEAGGTKFVCAVGRGPGEIHSLIRFPTTTPEIAIPKIIEFFKSETQHTPLSSIGIASFGPLDPREESLTYGFVTTTPKPGWAHTDFAGPFFKTFGVPVGFDTDVNGAVLGEFCWGAGAGLDSILYLTVGTGIGGGAISGGKIVHGLLHPEMGHIRIPHDYIRDPFPGNCPYHQDCFEGLACGLAISARWGTLAQDLPDDHPAWDLEAHYLALALVNYTLILSPQRIVLGGGVMDHPGLFDSVRSKFRVFLNDYIQRREITENTDQYIVPPALGNQAGVLGAIALAQRAFQCKKEYT